MNANTRTGFLPTGGFRLSYSAGALYRHCPAKFWYKHFARGNGVYVKGDWTPEMSYGKFWHAMYQTRVGGGNDADLLRTFTNLVKEEAFEVVNNQYFQNLCADLDWYFEQTKDAKVRILFCEDALVVPVKSQVTGLTHELVGIPDLVAEIEAEWGGGLYIIDHKTYNVITKTGRLYINPNEQSILRNKHGRQMPFYQGLWNIVNPERKCFDGIINFVPQNVCEVNRQLAMRKGTQATPQIHREFVFHNEEFIDQQINRWVAACDEIVTAHPLGFEAFRIADNGDACTGGWKPCQFLEACEATGKVREDMLEFAFERR